MSSARKPSGFVKSNYDKLVLLSALLVLLISALVLLMWTSTSSRALTPEDLRATNPRPAVPLDTTGLDALGALMAEPFQIPFEQRRMLVGDLRVSSIPDGLPIPFDAAVCPFTQASQPTVVNPDAKDSDGDGMPDVWELQYGLNPFDPSDAAMDTDGNGFSNLEEFLAGTDPTNPAEFPPPSAKLRVAGVRVTPFKLRFLGTSRLPNGDLVYQLNLRTLEQTFFPRLNQEVEGFTVVGYEEATADGPTLTLQQGDKTIRLIQGRVRDEQAYVANLVFLVDGQQMRVNIGDMVKLLNHEYKVIDIRDDRVVIRDDESGRETEVGMISQAERRELTNLRR